MAERPAAPSEPVTVTIARRVAPGREADFEEFSSALTPSLFGYPSKRWQPNESRLEDKTDRMPG